jgi:hypothetical protein
MIDEVARCCNCAQLFYLSPGKMLFGTTEDFMARLSRRQFAFAAALTCIGCAGQTSKNSASGMQSGAGSKEALFKTIDKNGDGNISQGEMTSWMQSLDTDGNGAVSYDEWAAAP